MKLLYCYTEFLDWEGTPSPYRGLDTLQLNLSPRERFLVDGADRLIRGERKNPLPPGFWANPGPEDWRKPCPEEAQQGEGSGLEPEPDTNVRSINVVTGENGAGKSTVMQYLIDLLDALYDACWGSQTAPARHPRHPVWQHRNLLLFDCGPGEDEPDYLLFDYVPQAAAALREAEPMNFPAGALGRGERRLVCGSPVALSQEQSPCKDRLAALLNRTKLIYMTNTLTQRDFERNQGWNDPQRQRSAFVYDCSTGAAVGGEIAQYFPHEVYKQVRYVFDRSQYEIRKRLGDKIRELRLPLGLTLRLRMEEFPRMKQQPYQICDWDEREKWETIKNSSHGFSWKKPSLARKLGALAVVACEENLKRALDHNFRESEAPSAAQSPLELQWETVREELDSLADRLCRRTLRSVRQTEEGLALTGFSGRIPKKLENTGDPAACVVVSPHDELIIGWRSGTVSVWNQSTDEINRNWSGCGSPVSCLACNGSRLILIGCEDGSLWLWLPGMESPRKLPCAERSPIRCADISDYGWVVLGRADGTLELWYLETLTQKRDLRLPAGVSGLLLLSEDLALVGAEDGTLRLWNLRSGELKLWAERHGGKITCLARGPRNHVVSGSADGALRIWDPEIGKCVADLDRPGAAVRAIVAAPSGLVLSGSDDGQIRIWDSRTSDRCASFRQEAGSLLDLGSRIEETQALFAWDLILCSKDYVDLLEAEEDGLFSHFAEEDPRTYTLSLEAVQKDESLYERIIRFVQKYRYICEPAYTVDFDWGLSSGEENMLRLFSELFYVFDRDYSSGNYGEHQIYNKSRSGLIHCDSVLLFMDEADLTLHPEWQRRLIYLLTAVLPAVYPKSCVTDIQLLLSTHSPLLLGDMPRENVTCLRARQRDGGAPERCCETLESETFGQNIHTILRESFFLKNGTVGAFAAGKINRLAWELEALQRQLAGDPAQAEALRGRLPELRRRVRLVAPGILRGRLEIMLSGLEVALDPDRERLLEALKLLSPAERQRLLQRLEREARHD